MSRIIGIDYGKVRTGLAITDALGITAQGLETIISNGNDKIILKRLAELVEEYEIDKFVIGNPINMDGTESDRSRETRDFIHKLKSRFNAIEVISVDERLTTVEAHKTMNILNINKHKKKQLVDTISAVYILENYINKAKSEK
ncbi:MAG: Holliday junction resolvase RuvX [Clostridia bacterium]|nr:Holliday junction resolvase RuvX [Clostridia bacterium]